MLIVGLDLPNIKEAENMVKILSPAVNFFKIGHQLAFTGGLELARDLIKDGKKLFLDLKLLDINHTIYKAVENIADMNVNMLTIHAYPAAMKAAVKAAKGSNICLLAVTVLTSMDDIDLTEAGYRFKTGDLVVKRAQQASKIGMGGIVASAQEASMIKQHISNNMVLVTPGIRPSWAQSNDQKRVMTPIQAVEAGADYLVVARPIINDVEPLVKAVEILKEIGHYG